MSDLTLWLMVSINFVCIIIGFFVISLIERSKPIERGKPIERSNAMIIWRHKELKKWLVKEPPSSWRSKPTYRYSDDINDASYVTIPPLHLRPKLEPHEAVITRTVTLVKDLSP